MSKFNFPGQSFLNAPGPTLDGIFVSRDSQFKKAHRFTIKRWLFTHIEANNTQSLLKNVSQKFLSSYFSQSTTVS